MIDSTVPTTIAPEKSPPDQPRELNAARNLLFTSPEGEGFQPSPKGTLTESGREFIGQERALAALELGLGVGEPGYNIFVSGLTGANKLETLRRWLAERVSSNITPGDWVYVHNFNQPDAPRAIYLKAGHGRRLKQLMDELVKTLREELPKAFREEAFDKEKLSLTEKYNHRAQDLNTQFAALARERGFQVQVSNRGNA
jgi:hypothetical protein